jgi:hypothetical protein
MKKQWLGVIGAAGVVALLGVLGVPAQAGSIRADVPFSFQMGDKSLPKGKYYVETEQAKVLLFGLTTSAFAVGNRLEKAGNSPKLVFHRYGSTYVLREVWTGSAGRSLPASRQEKELNRREVAAFDTVVIPLS